MNLSKKYVFIMVLIAIIVGPHYLYAEDSVSISSGVDFVNRYVWRGMDFGGTPSIQPTLAVDYWGFELGSWAAYTLANNATEDDEIDFWISYSREFKNGVGVTFLVTDYYFPNAGIDFSNFNNYDDEDGPGAHLLEAGLSLTGSETFPISVSGYFNFYNEEGNNIYFQIDYPISVGETALNFFIGGTPGSKDNPDYYGTDDFAIINTGVTASKEIVVSESFSIPVDVSFILNPELEVSYVTVGFSF